MIEIITPAGFEHFFREITELIAAGPTAATATEGATLADRYGLQFPGADRLPDIIQRFTLTP